MRYNINNQANEVREFLKREVLAKWGEKLDDPWRRLKLLSPWGSRKTNTHLRGWLSLMRMRVASLVQMERAASFIATGGCDPMMAAARFSMR